MNNNPIGWPDSAFGYNASTQTLTAPTVAATKAVTVNAPSSYTGNLLDLQAGGSSRFNITSSSNPVINISGQPVINAGILKFNISYLDFQNSGSYIYLQSNGFVKFGGTTQLGNDSSTANTLAQWYGTNAQTFRVYNTFTSATNYERGKLEWSGNVFNVGTEKGSGGGTARSMALQTDGVTRVTLDATTTKLTLSDPATSQTYRLTAANYWLTLGQAGGTDKAFGLISDTASYVRFQLVSHGEIGWVSSSIDATGTADLTLRRDAANTLAQYNSTNAQTYRVYNTYTSSTNYERGKLEWASNVFRIGTEKGSGGGTARAVEVQTDSITRLALDTTGSVRVVTGLTVATLPAAPTVGMIARVTDASAPTIGSTVAGGGAANALCWYNGTNWTVMGI